MEQYASQLEQLRDKYPEEKELVNSWEKSLKKSTLFIDLQNHAAFKIIYSNYVDELKKLEKAIKDPALFKDEVGRILGLRMHERMDFIKSFLRPFQVAAVDVGYIGEQISKALTKEDNE